ncbi:inactive transglutaminase family protein [Thiohalorhabdus methylotrophus]|uniref:Inactive transglutaminase family protein n=1 Tax=Thiohalorhabdus methylotrophus TaxID=3242694 RepID=A0ABV4TYH8_9GAMM
MPRKGFYFLVGLLLLIGLAMTLHRHLAMGVPLAPGQERQVWEVEAVVSFTAEGGPAKVSLALPTTPAGFSLLTESTASSGYGLSYLDKEKGRWAQWAKRRAEGKQQLYYAAQFLVTPKNSAPLLAPPQPPGTTVWERPLGTAAEQILEQARRRSADAFSLAREITKRLSAPADDGNVRLLLNRFEPAPLLVRLLHQAGISAREVHGLRLRDGRRRQTLEKWVYVLDGQRRLLLNPESGRSGRPDNLLLWSTGHIPLLEVEGGTGSRVLFSMLRHDIPASTAMRNALNGGSLLDFSIHSLPLEEQALFKNILLIPVGALVVVLLRILVGIKTSGTFMPVLFALAFMQTTLLTGLIAFLLIVGTGLLIRNYLSHLNLLLVARVSAVIITVILIISAYSVLAYRLGFQEGLVITFFPTIILAWTIERMSILWEEEGPWEVVIQGGGSLLTAVLAYLAMTAPLVRHLSFNFLGVQLILLALILMLGSYTGYRLSELRRFEPLAREQD